MPVNESTVGHGADYLARYRLNYNTYVLQLQDSIFRSSSTRLADMLRRSFDILTLVP